MRGRGRMDRKNSIVIYRNLCIKVPWPCSELYIKANYGDQNDDDNNMTLIMCDDEDIELIE